jgi:hypothetical protein
MKNPFTLIGLVIGAGLLYNALPLVRRVYGRYRFGDSLRVLRPKPWPK